MLAPTRFGGAPALRQFRYFASGDVEETCARISAVMQPHTLRPLRAVPLRSHMDVLPLGGSAICAIRFGAMDLDVGRVDGYHLVLMCLSGHARLRLDGAETEIGGRHAAIVRPGTHFTARFSEDCEQLLLRIPTASLQAHTGTHRLTDMVRLDLAHPALQPWLGQFGLLVRDVPTSRLATGDPRVGQAYERLLIELLRAHDQGGVAPAATPAVSPATVRRAEDYMQAHAGQPLQLQDIAAAAGVPARTLQTHFRSRHGTSPMLWLRDLRLQRVRARLLQARDDASVTGAALEAGFAHLGRFAQAYAARFGEAPSQTLRAARHTPR